METEKSVAAKIKKVRNDIPNDLVFSILSKLPVKSLNRFGCVRKSWSILFKNRYFMSMFRKNLLCKNHSYYKDTSLLQLETVTIDSELKFVLYSLSGERYQNKTKLDWPNLFEEADPEFDVVGSGSINGILCLVSKSQPNNRVVFWNPTTDEFKIVPISLRESVRHVDVEITRHGFGYVSIADEYKLIRQVMYNPKSDTDDSSLEDVSYDLFWEIYSLRSNSWRELHSDVPYDYREDGICLDGMCHWLGEDGYDIDRVDEVYLLSFDLSKEAFLITPIPSECDSRIFQMAWKDLVVLNGFIALISHYKQNDTFHISILGEIGVKESWTKLYIVCPLPCIERPITSGNKRYIISNVVDGTLVCIDLSTLMVEQLNFEGYRFWGKTIIYKQSSLPIGGINQ
ncbi:putative F-box domain-containing protein [Medicago truncatula]|uniref:Cyclin-like F-box; F-box protein interaction domain n=1 Tax=Medicago truncatula TaxID=3880 RepID=Q2HSG7_MEDTR|nr:F-box/kelch-repeat protein At3g06240 [Medicago truncatula]ABD33326.1 Cyclin-like F-box; F-box protein interaction domain [Medicago truncatula]ABN09025.1 Cyclin-like F-box; F-box protein interaction domain [Medicago truncatula]AES77779.1 F-box protein interaction domain protein [Medicago truncatula]RHN44523.1 putative F-box domain-containing protein [Medicago truncatula]